MILATVLQLVLFSMLCLLAVYNLLFAVQAFCAVKLLPTPASNHASAPRPTVAILVPAHNEENGIERTLRSLLPELGDDDHLVVVADNCTDETATVAAACGADVCSRHDLARQGKGYALDYGIRYLSGNAPQVVIVIDADCVVTPGIVDVLAKEAWSTRRPVQALDLMIAPPGASLLARIAMFAWTVKNHVRPSGYKRLGLPCQLMGTGMAFPWQLIKAASLASGELVEDMKLGMDLTERGSAPIFCPQVAVSSYFPESNSSLKSQRYRWEHGHLGIAFRGAPLSMLRALRTCNWPLCALVLDAMVPPLTLLILATTLALLAAAVLYHVYGVLNLLVMAVFLFALMTSALTISWWRFGREQLSCWDIIRSIIYVFWKIPVYVHFVIGQRVKWTRSARNS
jgi:cellulose synthase/poly-beta-1,6-N-acetylglucosamine synthase-like glycosyltransferase